MFIPIEISQKKSKKRSKKAKFAISIDEQGRSAYYVRKLKYFLKEKYPFLKEECSVFREKSLKAAKPGDFVVFGIGKKYDYTTMSMESFLEDVKISDKIDTIDLETEYKLVKKAIKRYAEKNYSEEKPKQRCCKASTTTIVTPLRVVRPARTVTVAACKPRPRKVVRDWNVQVNNTYVLLTNGSRYETRKITKCGNRETVSIDGVRYTVRRDYSGRGILV